MLGAIGRDIHFARRSLRRTPVLTAAAVLSIAIGIAATTSVFSIVDAALFRPPPFDHPDQLAALFVTRQTPNRPIERERWSWTRYRLLGELSASFEQVASVSQSVLALTNDDPQPINAEVVSATYLPLLRVQPIAGRAFSAADEQPDAPAVALIGYDLWQSRYGADQSIIGRTIGLNGVTITVIGILPRGFVGLTGRAQLWVSPAMPPRMSYADYLTTNQNFISVVGRLRSGTTIDAARAELAIVGRNIQQRAPSQSSALATQFAATAVTLNEARIDPSTRTPMLLLLVAVGCLLLLACANVAGLLLGNAVSRRREIAIRIATGATRSRIVQQLLVEASTLAAVGGLLGVLVAVPVTMRAGVPAAMWRGRNFYGAISEFSTPRVDMRVLLFSIAICALVTLIFGLVPALQATKLDLTSALKSGIGSGVRAGGSRFELRRVIVAAEAFLAMVLLVAGGSLAATWGRIASMDVGFDRTHLLTFLIRPSEVKYPVDKAPALLTRLLDDIQRLPSVEAASVDGCAPVGTGCANSTLYVLGRPQPAPNEAPPVLRHYIGPNHFRMLGVPVLRGRVFTDRDRAGSPRVAVINQTAAKRFWPDEDPIGKRVWFGGGSSFNSPDSSAEIVGIVGNVAYQSLDEHPFQPDFYTPYAQFTYASRTILVRTRGEPIALVAEVRRAVSAVDPTLALFEVRSMEERMGDSWARLSYQTKILGAFAVVALFLAATGIFAVVAHVVSDRRREIGIRVALGATHVQVLTAVGGSGARPALIGLVAGVPAAVLVGRGLAASVYGIRPFEPRVIGAVVVTVVAATLAAAYLAARRALSVDPLEAIRNE
ncbi:MAG: ABC transporter permease [bacterium]